MKQRWLPEAEREFDAAIDFLIERAGADIATQFAAAVHSTADRATEFPALGAPGLRRTRHLRVLHFPYVLVYRPAPRYVEIIAIAHQRRRPGYWAKRR